MNRFSIRGSFVGSALVAVLGVATLHAQPVQHAVPDSAWTSQTSIISRRELAIAGVSTLTAVAFMPFDRRITAWSQRPGLQRNTTLSNAATVFRNLGGAGTIVLSLGTYGVGVVTQNRTIADIGLHSGGAIVVGTLVGSALKGTIGRARPATVSDSNAADYMLGRGFRLGSAYQSMPSGHTMAAFALATVIASESRHRWPGRRRWIAPVAYGAATAVGLSRIYNDVHWASDVVLGAGVGIVSGLAVVRFQHAHPGNWIDRHFLPAGHAIAITPIVPRGGASGSIGAAVSLTF